MSSSTKKIECQYPDYKKIVEDCKKKILQKYPEYHNSWQGFNDFDFWEKRV